MSDQPAPTIFWESVAPLRPRRPPRTGELFAHGPRWGDFDILVPEAARTQHELTSGALSRIGR